MGVLDDDLLIDASKTLDKVRVLYLLAESFNKEGAVSREQFNAGLEAFNMELALQQKLGVWVEVNRDHPHWHDVASVLNKLNGDIQHSRLIIDELRVLFE